VRKYLAESLGTFALVFAGASMNPARSLAPAILSGNLHGLWIYLTAPIIGSSVAVPLWGWAKPEIRNCWLFLSLGFPSGLSLRVEDWFWSFIRISGFWFRAFTASRAAETVMHPVPFGSQGDKQLTGHNEPLIRSLSTA
jgi:hypothetical protein